MTPEEELRYYLSDLAYRMLVDRRPTSYAAAADEFAAYLAPVMLDRVRELAAAAEVRAADAEETVALVRQLAREWSMTEFRDPATAAGMLNDLLAVLS
jgi:predicted O-methyltransferase YrrM